VKQAVIASLCLLLCACVNQTAAENNTASAPISFRGTTVLRKIGLLVSIPASAMPSGLTGCRVEVEAKGTSGGYGFELNDTVWDVNIYCDREDVRELFDAIKVCLLPQDGEVDGKVVYQQRAGIFSPLPTAEGNSGYACGLVGHLSLFTLGPAD
jgi:hypothetical protein